MHDYIDLQIREARPAAATDHTSICHVKSAILSLTKMQPGKDAAGQRTLLTICQQGESMDSELGRRSLRQRGGVQGGDGMGRRACDGASCQKCGGGDSPGCAEQPCGEPPTSDACTLCSDPATAAASRSCGHRNVIIVLHSKSPALAI